MSLISRINQALEEAEKNDSFDLFKSVIKASFAASSGIALYGLLKDSPSVTAFGTGGMLSCGLMYTYASAAKYTFNRWIDPTNTDKTSENKFYT